MSAFAVQLDRLLVDLRSLPPASTADSRPTRHVQHATIRLQRAYTELKDAGPRAPATTFLRLRNRLEELDEALAEAASDLGPHSRWHQLRRDTVGVIDSIQALLASASTPPNMLNSLSNHSRTPSVDLPRRHAAPSDPPAAQQADPAQDLAAFLSHRAAASNTGQADQPPAAAARARALSEIYTLFQLSTSPSAVLPPGQTLRSIFQTSSDAASAAIPPGEAEQGPASLEDRISTQLHRAYFDSFAAIFASSSASSTDEQYSAWSRLAQDLAEAVLPLVPSRLKTANGSPLPQYLAALLRPEQPGAEPGKAPEAQFDLGGALEAVRETVRALGRLCAPVRDDTVRSLASDVEAALSTLPGDGDAPDGSSRGGELVGLVRRTLELAEAMHTDVKSFRTGAVRQLATEEELRQIVREEAGARERALVEGEYGGLAAIRRETVEWCVRAVGKRRSPDDNDDANGPDGAGPTRIDVAAALVETLFRDQSVALPPPPLPLPPPPGPTPASPATTAADAAAESPASSSSSNVLPPILLAISAALFALQNRFQALTILACLLVLSPATVDPSRVWALLESELAPSTAPPPGSGPAGPVDGLGRDRERRADEPTPTRIAHLVEELLPPPPLPPASESEVTRIRTGVERLLRYEDPVWRLLYGRLKTAVGTAMGRRVEQNFSPASRHPSAEGAVPARLRTGRAVRSGGTSRPDAAAKPERPRVDLPPVKGFDAVPLLREQLQTAVQDRLLGDVWEWIEDVWGGVLGWTSAPEDHAHLQQGSAATNAQ